MVVAGGFVAWVADKLGRTLGKKRLTLFGLRPRHTATMITVLTGMFIPFITIVFVAMVSSDVREWIAERDKLKNQVGQLTSQRNNLLNSNSGLQTTNLGLKKENDNLDKRLAIQSQHIAEQKAQVDKLTAQTKTLIAQTKTLQGNLKLAENRLSAAKSDLAQAEKAKGIAQRELDSTNKQLAETKQSFFELKRQSDELEKQYGELLTENSRLLNANKKLSTDNLALAKTNEDLRKSIENNNSALELTSLQLDQAKTDLAAALNQFNALSKTLVNDFGVSRYQPLMLQVGDELARINVPAHSSAETVQALFENLVQQSRQFAVFKGAKAHPETGPTAASFFPGVDDQGHILNETAAKAKIIANSINQADNTALIATSFANSFVGEWVPISVKPSGNPLVYRQDQKIAEVMVNGSDQEAAVVQRIQEFLRTAVRPKALKDNMIPISGQEDQFAQVPLTEMLQAAHQIMSAGKPMKLAAVAGADTRAADPLLIHLRVR